MIPDGIYFHLPEAAYHADPALGSTDLKAILTNPVQWHWKNRNPLYAELTDKDTLERESVGKRFGTALHTIVLEPDQFHVRYALEEDPPADLPATKEEINDGLVALGHKALPKGMKRIEYVAASRMAGLRTVDDWLDEAEIRRAGREPLSRRWWRSLELLRTVVEKHSAASKYLSRGRAEVSVFWTDENGIRLKVRFDYLRVRVTADLKSYYAEEGKEAIQSFVDRAQGKLAYDFSAAHYMDCRFNVFPELVRQDQVYDGREIGDLPCFAQEDDTLFAREVAAYDNPTWAWIACMTQGAPEVDVIEFPLDLIQAAAARVQVTQAIHKYTEFRRTFGDDDSVMWVHDRGIVRLTDHNFRPGSADRGLEKWEQG